MSFFRKLFGREAVALVDITNPCHAGVAIPSEPAIAVQEMPPEEAHSIQRRVAWMRKYEMRYQMFDAPLVPTEEPATTFRYEVFAGSAHHLGRITITLDGFSLDLRAEALWVHYDVFPTLEEAADELIRVCGGTVVP